MLLDLRYGSWERICDMIQICNLRSFTCFSTFWSLSLWKCCRLQILVQKWLKYWQNLILLHRSLYWAHFNLVFPILGHVTFAWSLSLSLSRYIYLYLIFRIFYQPFNSLSFQQISAWHNSISKLSSFDSCLSLVQYFSYFVLANLFVTWIFLHINL